MKYVKKFDDYSEYIDYAYSDNYMEPHLSLVVNENSAQLNKSNNALKFTSPTEATLGFGRGSAGNYSQNFSIEYSTDGKNWNDWDGNYITFGNGVNLFVRGNNPNGFANTRGDYYCFFMEGENIQCLGNVMHLLSYKEDLTTIPNSYCFSYLFHSCYGLLIAPKLPATTLANYCYFNMFQGCTSLTITPELPATTLSQSCYSYMFNGCSNLTKAQSILPATTMAVSAYTGMFYNCTSLVNAPALPATTLANACYGNMFHGCESLTTSPELPATDIEEYCYLSMFANCTSLVNAPSLPATTLDIACYVDMFEKCKSLTTAPELPAKTMAQSCYQSMFRDCTSLNNITMLATDITASDCLKNWVSGVALSGTFTCASGMSTVIPSGTSGIPTGWAVNEQS